MAPSDLHRTIHWQFTNRIALLESAAIRHLICGDMDKAHILQQVIYRWERVERSRICRLFAK